MTADSGSAEVAQVEGFGEEAYVVIVAVRDSKDPEGPALTFTPATWVTFVRATSTFH
ncbi:hypothetical protein DDE19_02510 [Micromonospora ureilytica]|uniref:DUF397 domain-containing protein n=1 Tax=Micromonospora ureilytica TaxID=709868 RepID=A0A3N9Y3W6_9ACTN|nr:DUF397 domain-containing protein [Micromonospora ureilytica]RQX19920.1 hypothetical protein DDE19_02510 [Micromonospora ureilytica]